MVEQQSLVDDYYDNLRRVDGVFTFVLDGNLVDYPVGSPERALLIRYDPVVVRGGILSLNKLFILVNSLSLTGIDWHWLALTIH
jgi:hypothetical protein